MITYNIGNQRPTSETTLIHIYLFCKLVALLYLYFSLYHLSFLLFQITPNSVVRNFYSFSDIMENEFLHFYWSHLICFSVRNFSAWIFFSVKSIYQGKILEQWLLFIKRLLMVVIFILLRWKQFVVFFI